jgi:hypothetical protein
MRWWDILLGARMWTTWLQAAYITLRFPDAKVSKWCDKPGRCPLRHRVVVIAPPNKPMRFGLKHIEGT